MYEINWVLWYKIKKTTVILIKVVKGKTVRSMYVKHLSDKIIEIYTFGILEAY